MRGSHATLIIALTPVLTASPLVPRQAVTAAISPSSPPPPGCTVNFPDRFGVAVVNISTSAAQAKRQESRPTANPVSEIGDGQIQAPSSQSIHTMTPVTQIGDGQIQNGESVATQTVAATAETASGSATGFEEGLLPATLTSGSAALVAQSTASGKPPAAISTAANSASSRDVDLVACKTNSTLTLSLSNGVLMDSFNRTGYIASNFQFQFDDPPQSGSIYTAGWSVCSNGSLALGGSAVFWQCLSGSFYNLYDRWWAPQCNPIYINTVRLITC